jgi:DNA-binding transcriptional ArsR family regulator
MTASTVRRRILHFISRYPGVHLNEVERQLGLSGRLAAYHLEQLEQEGRVTRIDDTGYARYATARTLAKLSRHDVPFLLLMRRPPALRITLLLLSEGPKTPTELAAALDLARPSITYHLGALVAGGIAQVRREGRQRWYRLGNPRYVRGMLDEFEPVPGSLDAFSSIWNDLFG